jgi:hypothetical protein
MRCKTSISPPGAPVESVGGDKELQSHRARLASMMRWAAGLFSTSGGTNVAFVKALYEHVLSRPADQSSPCVGLLNAKT